MTVIRSKYLSFLTIAAVLLLVAGSAEAQDVSVRAFIQQSTVYENQEALLNIEISGGESNSIGTPELPDFGEWFTFAGSRGRSQNISIVNGRMSSTVTYTYSIIPVKTGTAVVPPVKVPVAGKTYETKEFTVNVAAAGSQPQTRSRGGVGVQSPENEALDLFVLAVPDKRSVYQNEGVTVDYKVYIGPGITVEVYSPQNQPHSAGFWAEDYPQLQPVPQAEIHNDRQYQTAVLKQVELFPTSPGEFSVDPLHIEFTVRVPRRRSRDMFDSFFDRSMFGTTRNVRVNSSKLNLEVKPLPETGRPQVFTGAVGRYDLSVNVDNRTVKENDSVTLTVKISGQGNIKLLEEPALNITGTHEKYDPQISESIVRENSRISGSKTFEYVIIPRQDGTLKIDPVEFAFFDPAAEKYTLLKSKPISVTVEKGVISASRSPRNLTREEVRLVGSDIRFIKEIAGDWQDSDAGVFTTSFFLLLLVPAAFTGGAFVYSRHLEKLNADIGYKRSRRATAAAAKHLKKAKASLDKNDPESFYPTLTKALHDYIADKLNIAAAGIVTHELRDILKKKQVDQDLADEYINCLERCDFFRFAASGSGASDDMKSLYESSSAAIAHMEERLKRV